MKKTTTSDQLKLVFEHVLHSDPKDWKRTARSTNEEGQAVREFTNNKNGAIITVTEMEDGYFNLKGKDLEANVRLPAQFLKASAPALSTPEMIYGPIANEAADKAIAIIMNDEPRAETEDEDFDGSEWGVPKKLLDDAGKALANRHCFAISGEDEDCLSAMITPIRFFQEEGHCSDQSGPVGHLLPKCAEEMESTWGCYEKSVKTHADYAQYLQKQGFQWSRDFQNYIDASLTEEISKKVAAMEDAPSPKAAVDQIMKVVIEGNEEGNDEIPGWLLKQADAKELASRFYFIVGNYEDMGGLVAIVAPKGMGTDESKKSYSIMKHLFPEVEYVDDCVMGLWAFPASVDTPLKLAQKLADAGFEFNAEYQDDDLKPQLAGLKTQPAAKQDAPKP